MTRHASAPRPHRVAVLGGGITGLAAALRLSESPHPIDWRLFERSPRLGGVLHTVRRGDYLVERSADNFLTREPEALELCRRVGLADELTPTDSSRRRALVVCRGRVVSVPEGFVLMSPRRAWPVLTSSVLSLSGKARLACEPLVPVRRSEADESIASFARRRLGREVFERLVQPLVGGIYTADPERLSMQATMPQFVQQELQYGSLVRAAMRNESPNSERGESGARYGLFVAPREGMQRLVDALEARLDGDRLERNRSVSAASKVGASWRLTGDAGEVLGEFDDLISALPARAAAEVFRGCDSTLAERLGEIEYAGCSVVCLAVRDEQIGRPVAGFGFVVPRIEGRRILAASFASYKFPGRAPKGHTLIRVFVGGALQPELADRDDAELVEIACSELAELVGLTGRPCDSEVARWPHHMPQYHVGHNDRVRAIDDRAAQVGVRLAGAAYRGVGVPQCVRSGEEAAGAVIASALRAQS